MFNTSVSCHIVDRCMMLMLELVLLTFDIHTFGNVDQRIMLVLRLVLELVLIIFDDHTFGTNIGYTSDYIVAFA